MTDQIMVRAERPADVKAIHSLHAACFPTQAEADLVDRLRESGDAIISLVAEDNNQFIGHVLFSRVKAPFAALGLGPVAVAEEWRGHGIAAWLIERGLVEAREAGWDAVFVLGEPRYYERFGFSVKLAAGFGSRYAGPNFMVMALRGNLAHHDGPVDYAPAFAGLT